MLHPYLGMMPLLWIVLWSMLPFLAGFSAPDRCTVKESSSSESESPLLKSLKCYNDYKSYVQCEWREDRNSTLQLWFKTKNSREQCLPYGDVVQDARGQWVVQCRFKNPVYTIGIENTVFFLKKTETVCSSVSHKPLELSQHLRAQPPVGLSTHGAGDGGRWLSWSSPYPSSSSLSKNITYQLSYRAHGQDGWTIENSINTSMKLDKHLLLPGHRYEARVRAHASVGHWSHWSPVVTWQTQEYAGQLPRLHCVLDGENEVTCSWKVSREQADFISYQLTCRHNHTAQPEKCCVNTTVSSDLSGSALKYSCSLTVADAAHLLLELRPARNAKIFKVNQHIRPDPPQQVNVKRKDRNWQVEWTDPSPALEFSLYYQLCYNRVQDQDCHIQNISLGSRSLIILQDSLVPSQSYQVKVRSLVVPGDDSMYSGIPSEWTKPVMWDSAEATWSLTTLIYVSLSVFVAAVFFALYCAIPACHRRVILWVDSVPSPGKSKILSEIKSVTNWTLTQSENTSICSLEHFENISTSSSGVSLWPTKDSEKKLLEKEESSWKCYDQPSLTEEVNSSDSSSMSFSGPYIFCQTSEPSCESEDVDCEEQERYTPSNDSASPSTVNFIFYGDGYVHLPSRSVSRSTQDLLCHSDANTNMHRNRGAEQDQHNAVTPLRSDKTNTQPDLGEPSDIHQPPAYTSGPFTPWPQGGNIQASGYCQLPTANMRAEN